MEKFIGSTTSLNDKRALTKKEHCRENIMLKIHQIENKRDNEARVKPSEREKKNSITGGLSASFSDQEIKNLFFSYLTAMLLIEGLIFFFCFISHLASDGQVFPWKPYLFATFISPVAITFVFGLILLTFNHFFFNRQIDTATDQKNISGVSGWGKGERVTTFLQLIHRLPLLFSMLLLIAATALAYKLEDIVLYIAQAGATTAKYLFFTLIGALIVSVAGIAIWVVLNYRLKNKTLSADHQYRMKLMEQFGMVLLKDGTMLDKEGKTVYQDSIDAGSVAFSRMENLPHLEEIKNLPSEP